MTRVEYEKEVQRIQDWYQTLLEECYEQMRKIKDRERSLTLKRNDELIDLYDKYTKPKEQNDH